MTPLPSDIQDLVDQLNAADADARLLVSGLSDSDGLIRPANGGWCIAECLDHLATANRVYLAAMKPPAAEARALGRRRTGPLRPGLGGRIFIWNLEPPAAWWQRLRAPRKIRPRTSPPLPDAFAAFLDAQATVREFVLAHADLDLSAISFPNPFIRGLRFSIATGLLVITAHDRRHLWQAWNVRRIPGSGHFSSPGTRADR